MAFVQAVKSTFSATGGGTVLKQINGVSAGAVLGVFVQCGDQNASCTCADDVNAGNYTAVDAIPDGTNNNKGFSFYKRNSLAGSPTVTATFGGATPFTQIVVGEFSGRDATAPLDGHNGAFQAAAGTGTDAVSTGNLSTTVPDDIFGATWVENGAAPTITHGTGYTERLAEAVPMEVESADAVAAGNNPVTWTISAGAGMLSMGLAFKAAQTSFPPVGGFIAPMPPLW